MASACEQVAEQLREKIVSGRWKPGMRLPDRVSIHARGLGHSGMPCSRVWAVAPWEPFR